MSALPVPSGDLPGELAPALGPPQGGPETGWVPIAAAAELLGRSTDSLRRICRDKLSGEQVARQLPTAGGGKPTWHLHVSHDARLARYFDEPADQVDAQAEESSGSGSLAGVSDAKRDEAMRKAQLVVQLRRFQATPKADRSTTVRDLIDRLCINAGLTASVRTVQHWSERTAQYDLPADIAAELIDQRGTARTTPTSVSDAAWSYFCSIYLTPQQWTIAKCWRLTRDEAAERGWAWCGRRNIERLVRTRLDEGTKTLRRLGRDAWRKKHLAPIEQDADAWAAGQCWESDHSVLDFQIRVPNRNGHKRVRPQLTAWMDRRTRRITGWWISEQGNSGTIRTALVNALRDADVGCPEIVWLDNGKDFCASAITGQTKSQRRSGEEIERAESLLSMLGIRAHFAQPYNHNGKARIERFFGFVHTEFDREFVSWLGSNPGMVDRRAHGERTEDVMSLPTLDEVRTRFETFVRSYNARSEHQIDDLRDPQTNERLSPELFYDRYLWERRAVDQDVLPLLAHHWHARTKVYKWGVSVRLGGKTIRYGEMQPELELLANTDAQVHVSIDPEDTTSVRVWDEDFRLVCVARENGRYGGIASDTVSIADRKAAYNRRREQQRRAKQRVDVAAMSLSDAELASDEARAREIAQTRDELAADRRDRKPEEMPPIRLVNTKVDGREAQQAERAAKAVGSECDEMPQLVDVMRDRSELARASSAHAVDADGFGAGGDDGGDLLARSREAFGGVDHNGGDNEDNDGGEDELSEHEMDLVGTIASVGTCARSNAEVIDGPGDGDTP